MEFESDYSQINPMDTVKELFKDEQLQYITELSVDEIRAVAIILFLAKYLDIKEFNGFIENVLRLKVSKERKGRKEFIDLYGRLKEHEEIKQAQERALFK